MGRKRRPMSHEQAKAIVDREYGGNISEAARKLNIPRKTLSRWYNGHHTRDNVKRFIVTYAQNNTSIHSGFFNALKTYMKKWDADLICFKGRYRNPTRPEDHAIEYLHGEAEWWDQKISPFLLDLNKDLNENLIIYSARTQPTAVNPLSGYDTHTGHKSGIFPHPKQRLKTIPTPGHLYPKILCTTGAITVANYSDSKAGAKGSHHHIIGAVIIEVVDDKIFHLRHINAEQDGSFYDIAGGRCKKYTDNGIRGGNSHREHEKIDVLTMGDLHYPFIDDTALRATYDLIEKLEPKKVVAHDVIDFWRRNHHERSNRFLNSAKELNGEILVEEEVEGLSELLLEMSNPGKYEILIVVSNHHDAMDRWLNEESVDNLGANATYFHWLSYHKHKSATRDPSGYRFMDTLEFALSEKIDLDKNGIRFLKRDVPEIINGISHEMHGDIGPSGSRGTPKNLSKIGVKSTIGHGHSPMIVDGCFMVGVKCVKLGYAKGPNSWLPTDCIQYPNGKRTLVTYVDGKWHL